MDAFGLEVDGHTLPEVGGKLDALERALGGSSLKRTHSWMDDEIALADLDEERQSDSNQGDDDADEQSCDSTEQSPCCILDVITS